MPTGGLERLGGDGKEEMGSREDRHSGQEGCPDNLKKTSLDV